jgi:hypothetical protein
MRPRFSLRLLILLMAAASLFFGYSQIRRKKIWREVSEVEAMGVRVDMPDSFTDRLWQRRPRKGEVFHYSNSQEHLDTAKRAKLKLESMGVEEIQDTPVRSSWVR